MPDQLPPTPPDPPLPQRRADAEPADEGDPADVSPGREAYNVVSDTITGVNIRRSDNCLQAIWIMAGLVLGAGVGAIFAFPEGMLVGGFVGLLTGLFTSGIYLMVYRAIRHARGKHD
jgi:hypothetical protein